MVLGLCKVYSKYTSKNMATVLITLFKDYRIISNLGYFIADDIDINNIYINNIIYALYQNILIKNGKRRCFCYFGYIINFYSLNFKNIYKDLATAYYK